jgi:hypothetical protein
MMKNNDRAALKMKHWQQHQKLIKWLTAARRRAGLRQVDLGKQMGHSQAWMARVEAGGRRIDVNEFLMLAQLLRFDPCKAMRSISSLLLLLLALSASSALAQGQVTIYKPGGSVAGRAVTAPGGGTTFYDAGGNVAGKASTSPSGTTTFYDARGNVTGRAASAPSSGRK